MAISHSFGESEPAGYVIVEQFLRDVVKSVLESLVTDMREAQKAPDPVVRVRKRRPPTPEAGE